MDTTKTTHVITKDGQMMHVQGSRAEIVEKFKLAGLQTARFALVDFVLLTPDGPTEVTMSLSMLFLIGREHDAKVTEHGLATPSDPRPWEPTPDDEGLVIA